LVALGAIGPGLLGQDSTTPAVHPTMAELIADFRSSPVPRRTDLVGDWVNTTVVKTERFLTGRAGADHILSNPTGFRRANGELDWTLSMRVESGRVVFVSTTQWTEVEHSEVTFGAEGKFGSQRTMEGTHLTCTAAACQLRGACYVSSTEIRQGTRSNSAASAERRLGLEIDAYGNN
jgi:hypothetical protein